MATCHQDPEPELDYHLELDSNMENSDFSSGLEVTWGSSLTSETGHVELHPYFWNFEQEIFDS